MVAMSAKRAKQRKSKPLGGKVVLVTRAKEQAPALSSLLRAQGAAVREIPLIEILPPPSWKRLDAALAQLEKYDWLILTSVNGVEALFDRMGKLRVPRRAMGHLKIAAIGPATRAAIEARGFRVQVMPTEYVAEAVVKALARRVKGKRVLVVRAAVARDVIPGQLQQAGAQVNVVAAYQTGLPAASGARLRRALTSDSGADVITFTSSSTVKNFARLAGRLLYDGHLDGTALASVGPITSATLRANGMNPAIEAREYTMAGLAKAIVSWAKQRQKSTRSKS